MRDGLPTIRGTRVGSGPTVYPVKDYVYRGDQPFVPVAKSGPKPTVYDPGLCGSKEGYKQHIKFSQETCQPCRDAYNEYQRGLKAARKKES